MNRPSGASHCFLLAVFFDAREVVSGEECDQQIAAVGSRETASKSHDMSNEYALQSAFGIFDLIHERNALALKIRITITVVVDVHNERAGCEHQTELAQWKFRH